MGSGTQGPVVIFQVKLKEQVPPQLVHLQMLPTPSRISLSSEETPKHVWQSEHSAPWLRQLGVDRLAH